MADLFKKLHDKRARLFTQLNDPATVGVWKMVVDKYSDQAHFLFELLQNSDDAGATSVRILLYPDKLCYIHNGIVPFTITDADEEEHGAPVGHLNAITSIGASSKTGTNAIGKFGVGFKSVFQYTDLPHIEDDSFCFKIVNYIVPEKDEPFPLLRRKGETLFVIPFREPSKAYPEVLDKLKHLNHPLLFLRSLLRVDWEVADGEAGSYERRIQSTISSTAEYSFVEEIQAMNADRNVAYYHFFSRDFSSSCKERLDGVVAFSAQKEGALVVEPATDEVAYCYFPTKERTDLNFLIHAPFLLTDSREGIKRGEAWNLQMMEQLALLATDALSLLTSMKTSLGEPILNDNLFTIIPIDHSRFFKKTKSGREPISLFSFFYDRFVDKLSSDAIFRSRRGYVDARHTRYCEDRSLMDLLDKAASLSLLPQIGQDGMDWSFLSLTKDSARLFAYLSEHRLLSLHVTADTLIDDINTPFLQSQSLEWLKQLYGYFASRPTEWSLEKARRQMLIYCADGQFLPAFDESGKPLVFFPDGGVHSFAEVHPELTEDAASRRFFSLLGVSKPDLLSEVECVVLPRYRSHTVSVSDWATISRDMNLFVDVYQSFRFKDSRLERFLGLFAEVPFIPSVGADGVSVFRQPSEIYVELKPLKEFLAFDATAAFLDARLVKEGFLPEKREAFYQFLSAIGVSFGLKINQVNRSPRSQEALRLSLNPKSLRQYDNGDQQIEDCEISGFDAFFTHITKTASAAFFKLLSARIERQSSYMFQRSLEGKYSYVEKAKKTRTEETLRHTTAWHSIFSEKWLYDLSGELRTPSEIGSVDHLAACYAIDTPDILFFLGITDDPTLRGLNPEQRRAVTLVRAFESEGISIETLEEWLEKVRKGKI